MASLETDGLVSPMSRVFGDPPLQVCVSGWQLTEKGRMAYCAACAQMEATS